MNNGTKRAAGLPAVAALACPAAADAKRERPAKEPKGGERAERLHPWNVQGVVTAKGDTTVTVKIRRSSHGTRALRDTEVTFDVSAARLNVRDTNGDGEKNLADVAVGDRGQVKARVPRRRAVDVSQVIPAKLAIFRAPKPATEEPEGDSGEDSDEAESGS